MGQIVAVMSLECDAMTGDDRRESLQLVHDCAGRGFQMADVRRLHHLGAGLRNQEGWGTKSAFPELIHGLVYLPPEEAGVANF